MVLVVAVGHVVNEDGDGEDEDEREDEQCNRNNVFFRFSTELSLEFEQ